jgi:zinc-ribbon domain
MYCVQCGAENPEGGKFCHSCGALIYRPSDKTGQPASIGTKQGDAPPSDENPLSAPLISEVAPHRDQPTLQPDKTDSADRYKWAKIYGWFFVVCAVYMLVSGAVSVIMQRDVTPAPSSFGHGSSIGWAAAVSQGLIWLATGIAIVQKRKIAMVLVWVVTVMAGLGTLLRGLIPVEIVVWLLTLWLAFWFSKKKPLLFR